MKNRFYSERNPLSDLKMQSENSSADYDNWCGPWQSPRTSVYGETNMSWPRSPSVSSISQENINPMRVSRTLNLKRWAIFGSKKAWMNTPSEDTLVAPEDEVNPLKLDKKKSRKFKISLAKTQSSPNLRREGLGHPTVHYLPIPDLPSPRSAGMSQWICTKPPPRLPEDDIVTESLGPAIYFTVDPAWDQSKGDALLYLLPLPIPICGREAEECGAWDSHCGPHDRPTTRAAKVLRNLKDAPVADHETSFLIMQ